jgi:hypothetical protein
MRTMLIALALIATTAQAQQYDAQAYKPFGTDAYWEQRRQEQRLRELEHRQWEMERKQRQVEREVTCRGAAYESICRALY